MSESNSNTSTTKKSAKQYKQVPFDIELAKKIQSGEIEGRIVAENIKGILFPVRIICYNAKNMFPIVGLALDSSGNEYTIMFGKTGTNLDDVSIHIELPEEAPKQKEELTLGKCKEGDEVWIYSNYEYGPEYVKVKVGKFSLDTSSGHRRNVTFDNGFTCQELTSQICWYKNPITFHTNMPKGHAEIHGNAISFVNEEIPDITTSEGFHRAFKKRDFKPFDKVLVRENDGQVWHCDFYSYTDSVHGMHYCVGHCGNQILPYEGNEHLVGTTNNPE